MMDVQQLKDRLKNFLDEEGRLTQYPSKHKLQLYALIYLSLQFKPGIKYTERQVNEVLKGWHTFGDWAMLRRDLFDRHFFDRARDCSIYWLQSPQPALVDLGLEEAPPPPEEAETLAVMAEGQNMKRDPNKKLYSNFSELLKEVEADG